MLKVVEQYGLEYEIVFNIGKTYTMTFFEHIKRTPKSINNDKWNGDITLNGKIIEKVNSITYLGVEIMNNLRNDLHFAKRRNKAIAAVHSLKQLGFNSLWMHPLIKAQVL
jgi:hypothetical protein